MEKHRITVFCIEYNKTAGEGAAVLKSFPQPLTAAEEKYYVQKYTEGDLEAKHILIERNLRLVAHIVKKYNSPDRDLDDLISIGTIGLIKAVNTFDLNKGGRLVTYAARCIENELLMMIRQEKKILREVSLYEPIGTDQEGNHISLLDIISTEEAEILIKYIDEKLGTDEFKFYPGVSYRHCLIWNNGTTDLGKMTPPHDITGKVITEYLSTSENAKPLIELMKKSYDLLKDHPVNIARKKAGKRPANSIWLWGEGKRPALSPFEEIYGIKGAVVSAVDLIKGIGGCAKMEVAEVEGATGYIDTNFEGKAKAAIDCLERNDLVYVHFEAPDVCVL